MEHIQFYSESDILVSIDGEYLNFDVPPTVINGRTLVPVRTIFEALGLEVSWDSETQTISGTRDVLEIKLTINNDLAYKNEN